MPRAPTRGPEHPPPPGQHRPASATTLPFPVPDLLGACPRLDRGDPLPRRLLRQLRHNDRTHVRIQSHHPTRTRPESHPDDPPRPLRVSPRRTHSDPISNRRPSKESDQNRTDPNTRNRKNLPPDRQNYAFLYPPEPTIPSKTLEISPVSAREKKRRNPKGKGSPLRPNSPPNTATSTARAPARRPSASGSRRGEC